MIDYIRTLLQDSVALAITNDPNVQRENLMVDYRMCDQNSYLIPISFIMTLFQDIPPSSISKPEMVDFECFKFGKDGFGFNISLLKDTVKLTYFRNA